MDKYKERELRVTRMQDANWVKTITELKTLGYNARDKEYYVVYKKNNRGKSKKYYFDEVQYVEETKSFIFTEFNRNSMDRSEILDTVDSKEVLLDIEIETYGVRGDDGNYEVVVY